MSADSCKKGDGCSCTDNTPFIRAGCPNRAQPSPSTGGELPPPKYPQMRMLAEGDISECCGYTAEQMRSYRAEGEPATDSTGRSVRDAIVYGMTGYTVGDGSKGDFDACVEEIVSALAAREPAPVARDIGIPASVVSGGLPTNDEVYAEVCRQRGAGNRYVSTNAVNDVMQAVRTLTVGPCVARELPALRQVEELFGQYWDVAYAEGASGNSQSEAANAVLSELRALYAAQATAESAPASAAKEQDK